MLIVLKKQAGRLKKTIHALIYTLSVKEGKKKNVTKFLQNRANKSEHDEERLKSSIDLIMKWARTYEGNSDKTNSIRSHSDEKIDYSLRLPYLPPPANF